MASYIIQGETLKAIADEVRDLAGISESINPNEMIANMEQTNTDVKTQTEIIAQIKTALNGKASGNTDELEAIIDNSGVLNSTEGTVENKVELITLYADVARKRYENRILEITIMPPMDYSKLISMQNLFLDYTNLEIIMGEIDCYSSTSLNNFANSCRKIKSITVKNTGKVSVFSNTFRFNEALETLSILDFSSCTNANQCFQRCDSLKNLRVVAETIKISISLISSPLLTLESIQSIIDGLATVETAQTLTLHADAKILQSQVDSANAKGWTIAGGTVVSEEEYYE